MFIIKVIIWFLYKIFLQNQILNKILIFFKKQNINKLVCLNFDYIGKIKFFNFFLVHLVYYRDIIFFNFFFNIVFYKIFFSFHNNIYYNINNNKNIQFFNIYNKGFFNNFYFFSFFNRNYYKFKKIFIFKKSFINTQFNFYSFFLFKNNFFNIDDFKLNLSFYKKLNFFFFFNFNFYFYENYFNVKKVKNFNFFYFKIKNIINDIKFNNYSMILFNKNKNKKYFENMLYAYFVAVLRKHRSLSRFITFFTADIHDLFKVDVTKHDDKINTIFKLFVNKKDLFFNYLYKYITFSIFLNHSNNTKLFWKKFNNLNYISQNYLNFLCLNKFFEDYIFNDFFIDNELKKNKQLIFQKINNLDVYNINNNFFLKRCNFNNHYPILLNKFFVNFFFFSKTLMFKYKFYLNLFNLFIIAFFEKIFQKNVFFKINTDNFKKFKYMSQVDRLYNEYKNHNPRISKYFSVFDMIYITWYVFESKDLVILNNWIRKMLILIDQKNHKKFLNFFCNFINDYGLILLSYTNSNGFFLKIKGKISVTGNAKKKKIKVKIGELNMSKFSSNIIYETGVSKTHYGSLGYTLVLSY